MPEPFLCAPPLVEPLPFPGSLVRRSFFTEDFLFVPVPPGRPPDRPDLAGSGNRLVRRVQPAQLRDDGPGLVVQGLRGGCVGQPALPRRQAQGTAGWPRRDPIGVLLPRFLTGRT